MEANHSDNIRARFIPLVLHLFSDLSKEDEDFLNNIPVDTWIDVTNGAYLKNSDGWIFIDQSVIKLMEKN